MKCSTAPSTPPARLRELHDFSLRYVAPYREALGENARAQQLEEAWVLGLVRQESRFHSAIRSSAGAAGLMQLMPATAKWVARRMGMQDYSWSRVTDTGVNAALGTYYLRHVLDDLDGNPVLAAAAYNAGPGARAAGATHVRWKAPFTRKPYRSMKPGAMSRK